MLPQGVIFRYLATVPLGKLISIRFALTLHSHHGVRERVYIKTELSSLHVLQVGIAGAQMVCEPASPIPTI
jgi:hypothetical protein